MNKIKKILLLFFLVITTFKLYAQSLAEVDSAIVKDGSAIDFFGSSVSLSNNGSTALVGAHGFIVNGKPDTGKALVYVRENGKWVLQAELIADDPEMNARFGMTVSLSSDGNTAIVGAPYKKNDTIENAGKVYIFSRTGSLWSKQAEFISGEATQSSVYGWSVSMAGDGKTAIVGAKRVSSKGKVYIYTRSGNTWTKQGDIMGESNGDSFGESVCLTSDGNTAMIGAYYKSQQFSQQGVVYVYSRTGSVWSQITKFSATDKNSYDRFGTFVDISGDGNTAVIAASGKEIDQIKFRGKIYVFGKSGNTWTEQASFIDSSGLVYDNMGRCVISDDGNIILFGNGERKLGGTARGKVFVYVRQGASWSKLDEIYSSEPVDYDRFGSSLAISGDGKVSLIASPTRRTGISSPMGKVYFFENDIVISGINNEEASSYEMTCFPNPTDGWIKLASGKIKGSIEIEMLTSEGHPISRNKYNDMSDLSLELTGPSGLYFLKIFGANGEQCVLKVIKE
ncbi:hypothetical protein [Sporocytophaga myxococcoides]|uniref:hypothetical protein n=1 Tax=Sporocytophaga myxococcoides TaxID=153721 RepID=UPI0004064226|nr:hypothetical protein [Sporocytophaga myxococcoides]